MSISCNQGPVEWRAASFYTPPLQTIAADLQQGLKKYFGESTVKVVKCPDLEKWGDVATKGICGNAKLVEIGGPPYIDYKVTAEDQKKIYSIPDVLKLCNNKEALVIGAAAGSCQICPKNAELIPNVNVTDDGKIISNQTRFAEVNDLNNPVVGKYNSVKVGCLSNFFVSDGNNGDDVLYIRCKKRISPTNFTNAIREILIEKTLKKLNDSSKQIGLGGVFRVTKGKIRGHIMGDYAATYCQPPEEWIQFYDVGPELTMFTCLVTDDPTPNKKMNLRLEHTHYYSTDGSQQGGHYHDDVTPDTIEYEGYFNLAQCIYRVDNPLLKMQRLKSKL